MSESTAVALPDRFTIADLCIDLGLQRVRRGTVDIPLPKLSFDVLLVLARAAPKLVSVDELMSRVWQGLVVNPETVSQRIKLLRDALGDEPQAPRYIAGLRGRGYRLLPPVIPVVACDPSPITQPSSPLPATENGGPRSGQAPPAGSQTRRNLTMAIAGVVVVAAAALLLRQQIHPAKVAGVSARPTQVTVTGLPPRTVAVLPFDDLSIKRDNGQLALAVPEMVLQRLGTVKELIVIARSSSFAFIGQQVDAREIGKRLAARYLVEGALQRVDNRLRITAQLVDAQTGAELRSLSFDRQLNDIFELQDDIAGQIAATLQVQLLGADMHRVDRSRGTSLEAYLSYLDAQALLNRWTTQDAKQAVMELEHAIKLDPTFALAYAELARARHLDNFLTTGHDTADSASLLPLVNKALALDPRLGEAYAVRGDLQADFKAADADFRRGIELAPNYGPGYQMYAEALWEEPGHEADAVAMIEQAIAIDPIAPRNYYIKARLLLSEAKSQQAEQYFAKSLAAGLDFPPAIARLAELRWYSGQTAEGIKLIERALRSESQAYWLRILACAMYLDVGDRQAAGSVAESLPPNSDTTVMLAAYDRDFGKAGIHQGEWMYPVGPTVYSYWVSRETVALQSGAVDQTIESLEWSKNAISLDTFDFAPALVLAHLLKVRGKSAELNLLLPKLKAFADGAEAEPDTFHGLVEYLSGDNQAAIDSFTAGFRRRHSAAWWVRERDPMLTELRNDARYRAGFQMELDRAAKQRKLLEEMRDKGEVPRRSALGTAVPRT
jgi:TolB-like protein/DNA-binding winged helix-turn-helix (wHTH) protein/Tfp pilus assembly protein PilF